jgi:NTP pyrophosphatase (non-canonical NTP hydrolase)
MIFKKYMDIQKIQDRLAKFARDRNWEKFHNPKNLAMALSVECSELVEIFQWLDNKQSSDVMQTNEAEHVQEEMADIMIYLIRLADKLDVDLLPTVERKMKLNAVKYPIEKSKGIADKYNKL